jgi:RpiB/LacA/LacB family sugar-phosphate isomerase
LGHRAYKLERISERSPAKNWTIPASSATSPWLRALPQSKTQTFAMKVALAADHAGFDLKHHLKLLLEAKGFAVQDLGAYDKQPSDYPDFAEAIGKAIARQQAERGILVCGSGVGASIAANKIHGVRAGLCHDTYSAHQGVEHDDMNVLVLGSRVIGLALAEELATAFLNATYTREERHQRRLKKVQRLEENG